MRMTVHTRRHRGVVAIVTGLAMILPLVALPASPASASGTLVQAAPTQGLAVFGNAFTDQLQVTGASGQVTFAESSGAADLPVSSTGLVSGSASLSAGTYTASGTDTDTAGDSGTWSYSLTVLPAAPAEFTTTVDNVYQSEYSVAQQLGQGSSVQTPSQYDHMVAQFNPEQLAALYNAVQQNPEWYQIPTLMQTVAADVPGSGLTSTSSSVSTSTSGDMLLAAPNVAHARAGDLAKAAVQAGPGVHVTGPGGQSARPMVIKDQTEQTPVGPFQPQNCPANIPDAAVFALQIVVDVSQGAYNILAATAIAFADAIDAQAGIGIAAAVAGGVLLAAVIVHDVLAFQQQLAADCASNNLAGQVANIDNTTVQTYGLLTNLVGSVAQLQTTSNTTQQYVKDIQAQLTTLQQTFIQTISTDTKTLQTSIGSDTQDVVTQLQTDITGLQQDVKAVQSTQSTLDQQVIAQVNTDTSSVQSAISNQLAQVLNEIDTSATSLTSSVTQGNQQILNTIQANFSAQQGEYDTNLQLWIERALSQNGPPEISLELPASQGGFLNSKPVGVDEVVTSDMNALVTDGAKIPSSATGNFQNAQNALAAGQYIAAYGYFASCYQEMA